MGYWVYLARCGNNTIYTGATTDLIRRVREHNKGASGGRGAKYTASHLPVSLAQAWEVSSWSDALRLEHAIKKCLRPEKDQLIKQPERIYELALRRELTFLISETSQELLKQTDTADYATRERVCRIVKGAFMLRIALVAHDGKKPEIIEFAKTHQDILAQCQLTATGTTGMLIQQHTELQVTALLSGPFGGDQQIGSLVATHNLDMIIFLRDPLTAQAHEPDISALLRVCDVHNVPLATNRQSAEILMTYVKLHLEESGNNANRTG